MVCVYHIVAPPADYSQLSHHHTTLPCSVRLENAHRHRHRHPHRPRCTTQSFTPAPFLSLPGSSLARLSACVCVGLATALHHSLPIEPATLCPSKTMTMAMSALDANEPTAQHELMNALSALHLGGKYSDLTITCNYKQWACHRAIVCSRSGFFDGACSHAFKESQTGTIDLSEDDEDAVEQMIHYFYHLDYLNDQPEQAPSAMFRHRAYSDARNRTSKKLDLSQIQDPLLAQAGLYNTPDSPIPTPPGSSHSETRGFDLSVKSSGTPPRNRSRTPPLEADLADEVDDCEEAYESTESESHLLLHTQVYALAEKYDIPSLKQLAKRKFEMAVACYYDAPELADAIEFVYTSTIDSDRGLRDVILQLFRSHPQLASTQDIYAVITQTPTLALDLWKVERGLL